MAGGSASIKPLIRDNDLISSSVHKVLSNDDLLMEILLRLPILSLHIFKPVCKQWLSLITSQTFTLTRTRIPTVDPPSGLFIGRHCEDWGPGDYDFVSFDPRIPTKRSIHFSFKSKAQILRSCNGLLLCYMPHQGGKYSIYNPLSGMFKMLPPIHDLNYELNGMDDMHLACDPTKSPCYKVVHVGDLGDDDFDAADDDSIRIQTYSSQTGVWSVSDDRFSSRCFSVFSDKIYWNGAIHWLTYKQPFHVKLDIVDRPVLTNIQIPHPVTVEGEVPHDRKLLKSNGSLLLLCKDYDRSRHLNIYEMQTGSSEWSAKYFVNLDDMMGPFPTLRMPDRWDFYNIFSIVLGEREDDSFMVIQLSGNVLQYKFISETVTKLLDLGKGVRRCDCHEYIVSFARV